MVLNMFYLLLAIITFVFMEFVAWFSHKYIMHGFLWKWHKSHHTMHKNILEKNDLFALCFSVVSIAIFYFGTSIPNLNWLIPIGIGITAYGIFYFCFHDVIVHKRIKINFKTNNKYLKRMIRAHHIHHAVHTKKGARAFGFLYAPKKFETLQYKTKNKKASITNE